MPPTDYNYNVATDFPYQKCATDRWSQEIRSSAIVTALAHVSVSGTIATATFRDSLSVGDETILDGIVLAHSGQPLAPPEKPREIDGKEIVTPFPGFVEFNTVFTGRGDDLSALTPEAQRGTGPRIRLAWDAIEARGPKYVDLQFIEPIQLHDGEAYYQGSWTPDDTLSVGALMPATVVTPNVGGTGNCNVVDPGIGAAILIVPAAGDGAFDLDLANAVPLPAALRDGFWDVDEPTGTVAPSAAPGASKWHLLTIPQSARYLVDVPLGALTGIFALDVYRAEYVHPKWTVRVTVNKQSDAAGVFAGWFLMYRRYNPI
jgi:hypothetical protein